MDSVLCKVLTLINIAVELGSIQRGHSHWQHSYTLVLWDLFLAFSSQPVAARTFMSAVKCDLSQLGLNVPNAGLTGATTLRTATHTGTAIMKKD